ncbi:MAG: hypothetical protein CMF11_09685 [Idiomarina sp.]|nr:hypothetical protein [Idiomarina sp.]
MAKTGRPKAKVSITLSEDELNTLISGMESSAFAMGEEFYSFSAKGMEIFGKELLMLARLRGVRDSKYGDKNGD